VEQQSSAVEHAIDRVVQQVSDWQWPVVQSAAARHEPPIARCASQVPVTARQTR
jgi:hypothetical protein